MMPYILTTLVLIVTPSIIVKTLKRYTFLQFFGPVFYCYVLGILTTNVLSSVNLPLSGDLNAYLSTLAQAFVVMAIVQMLLSTKINELIKLSRPGILAFTLASFSVIISSYLTLKVLSFFYPGVSLLEIKHLLSMGVGVYVGGTANMAVLSQTLNVDPQLFLQAYSTDLVLSGILLILLMNFIPWVFGLFLRSFDFSQFDESVTENENTLDGAHLFPYPEIEKVKIPNGIKDFLRTFTVILFSLGVSWGIQKMTLLQFEQIALFIITTVSLLYSFLGKISKADQDDFFILGDYNLLIFCLAMGTMANFEKLHNLPHWIVLGFFLVLVFSTFIHLLFSYLFKIDRDISIITFTSSIFGPPFVICASQALKNKHVITTGIGTGLIGLALGTYLGLLFFNLV
jgi:uncharacterized membrane protein